MKFKQHYPNWATGFEPEIFTFNTVDELLNAECVIEFSKDREDFYQYSISIDPDRRFLMAEYDNGYGWWVVGYIYGEGAIELPIWQPKE